MKSKLKYIPTAILLSIALKINAQLPTKVIVPTTQSQFTITLPANPTTGYQWQIKSYNHKLLKFIKSEYIRPKTSLIGAGGQTKFIFKVIKPQTTKIDFLYTRPWEHNKGQPKTINITYKKM